MAETTRREVGRGLEMPKEGPEPELRTVNGREVIAVEQPEIQRMLERPGVDTREEAIKLLDAGEKNRSSFARISAETPTVGSADWVKREEGINAAYEALAASKGVPVPHADAMTRYQHYEEVQHYRNFSATPKYAGATVNAVEVGAISPEIQQKAATFDAHFGKNAVEFVAGGEPKESYRFVAKTTDGKDIEQNLAAPNVDAASRQGWEAIQRRDREGVEIASARLEWESKQDGPQVEYLYDRKQGFEVNRPSGISLSHERTVEMNGERQEPRTDLQLRREWNGLIEGGSIPANAPERNMQDLKSPAEMTNQQIVNEAREIHASFTDKMARWEGMPAGPERSELREEMKPLVLRENELREEYTGRIKAQEVSRDLEDRIPEPSIGYGR